MRLSIEKILFELQEIDGPVPKITTAGLRALGGNDTKAEVYILSDAGKKGTYWKKRGLGAANEDNEGTILVTADLTVYENQYKGAANAKWFGAKGDGITDESVAVNKALSSISSGKTKAIRFPTGTYKVTSGAKTVIANKSDFSIVMDANAKFLNTDFTDFVAADSATFSGKTAIITTATPHLYKDNDFIAVKGFKDIYYNGYFNIKVTGANTFTYPLIYTPSGPSSGGKVRPADISNYLLSLHGCSNATVKLNFVGTVQGVYVQSRLGWIVLRLQNGCSKMKVDLNVTGAAYGVWSGEYGKDLGNLKDSTITIKAVNVGYPLALWKSGYNCIFNVYGEYVHRCVYASAVTNSSFNILTRNYDICGILISNHFIESKVYSCENLKIKIKDFGSDLPAPPTTPPKLYDLVLFSGYDVNDEGNTKNIDLDIQANNAKYVRALYMRTANSRQNISDVTIRGLIDRSKLKDAEITNELVIGGENTVSKSGVYSGIKFRSWRVHNPAKGTNKPIMIRVSRLSDNITFDDVLSNSPKKIILPPNRSVVLPTQRLYTDNTTDEVTEDFLNKKYPLKSYPVGTTIFYYIQNKKFERKSATKWVQSSTATLD